MEITKKNRFLFSTVLGCGLLAFNAGAKEIDTNMAQMQAMDKITGKVSLINVPVNGNVQFGSFSIVVRACKTRPPEETPENFAFVDVVDDYNSSKPVNIFRGWMMSSTPALNPVEHPIYDVWLLKCIDGKVDKSKLLSAEELKDRDGIVKAPKTEPLTEKMKPSQEVSEPSDENPSNAENVSDEKSLPQPAETNPEITEERKLEDSAIVSPEPLIENEVQEVQEDGAPKSLLNIGNYEPQQTQESVESVPAQTDEGEPTALVVEEVVISKDDNAAGEAKEPSENQTVVLEETEEETLDMAVDILKN